MKKNFKLFAVALMATFLLTACAKVELQDGEEVMAKTEKGTITADELFTEMKEKYALNILLDMIDGNILDTIYTDKESETTFVNSQIEQTEYYYESYMSEQYSSFLDFINQSYGFKDADELRKYYALSYKKQEAAKDHSKTLVTNKEIEAYYEENTIGDMKASHILIQAEYAEADSEEDKAAATDAAFKLAQDIIVKLNEGADFGELAKEHSADSSAANGGDLDWFSQGDMTQAFEDAVIELKTNEYTKEPVETEYGYHIILKTGQKEKAKLNTVKDGIIRTLSEEKLEEDTNMQAKALISLRRKYGIEISDTALNRQYKTYVSSIES